LCAYKTPYGCKTARGCGLFKGMKHIKQNDGRLNATIQKIGCFFISCALVAQYKTEKVLNTDDIESVWQWAKETKRIDALDNIKDSASIINRFFKVLGGEGHFCEVGTFRDGVVNWYPAVIQKHRHIDAVIQKIHQAGPSRTHFRLVNRKGEVIEDPHEPPIKSQGVYYSILYAFIE